MWYRMRGAGIGRLTGGPITAPDVRWKAAERRRCLRDRKVSLNATMVGLSLMAHAAALVSLLLLVPDRAESPVEQTETSIALLFLAVPANPPPSTDAAPPDPGDIVSTDTEQSPAETLSDEPAPSPAMLSSETPAPTVFDPVPVPAASAPMPEPEPVAKAPSPPAPPAPAKRPAASHAHVSPAKRLTSPPSVDPRPATGTQAPANGSASPVAAPPLIPPRPVAGMETNGAPAYPGAALRRGEQGRVVLRVSVSADGAPLAVDLAETSGHESLDSAALSAVRRWRFVPAMQSGRPVPAIAVVPIRFRLDH